MYRSLRVQPTFNVALSIFQVLARTLGLGQFFRFMPSTVLKFSERGRYYVRRMAELRSPSTRECQSINQHRR
jgi:hypothetical protein